MCCGRPYVGHNDSSSVKGAKWVCNLAVVAPSKSKNTLYARVYSMTAQFLLHSPPTLLVYFVRFTRIVRSLGRLLVKPSLYQNPLLNAKGRRAKDLLLMAI